MRHVEVSPDGNYAMPRFLDGMFEIPRVLDLPANEVFEPISWERMPSLDIGRTAWSPDSRWLLFNLQSFTGSNALVPLPRAGGA